ncbi:MAG: RHS repeat-associated core domain-containing protein [Pseudomonadota bacterium]
MSRTLFSVLVSSVFGLSSALSATLSTADFARPAGVSSEGESSFWGPDTASGLAGAMFASALGTSGDESFSWQFEPEPPLEDLVPETDERSNFQSAEPVVEWEKRQQVETRLQALGPDLFGDGIDPHTGAVSFEQTDVVIPGNFALEVAVRRKRSQGLIYHPDEKVEFGDWEIAVPRIAVDHAHDHPWTGSRCSQPFAQSFPTVTLGHSGFSGPVVVTTAFGAEDYSSGVMMEIPGAGAQQVLESPNGSVWPDAQSSQQDPASHVTTQGWYLSCGSATGQDDWFVAHAPNGDTYTFDRVIVRKGVPLGTFGGTNVLERDRTILAATKVTDVHGNWVDYVYDSSDRLTRIHASDGREITLAYSGPSELISSVTANNRTWTYTYGNKSVGNQYSPVSGNTSELKKVTLPDNREWQFDLADLDFRPGPSTLAACSLPTQTVSAVHPSGAALELDLAERRHRQSNAALAREATTCLYEDIDTSEPLLPPLTSVTTFKSFSVIKKKLSGAGLDTPLEWAYAYEQDINGSIGQGTFCSDTAQSPTDCTNWTKVTDPEGNLTTYYHLWNAEPLGGKLVYKTIAESDTAPPLQTETMTYVLEGIYGATYARSGPSSQTIAAPARMTQSKIQRGSDTYTTDYMYNSVFAGSQAASYSWGQPISVTRSSNVATVSRTTETTYKDLRNKWILALPERIDEQQKIVHELTYDGVGNLTVHQRFEQPYRTFSYNVDGTLALAKDALNRKVTLSGYKRGLPQNLVQADGSTDSRTLSRVVDDNGWIMSSTDAVNKTVAYTYNPVGWLASITPQNGWSPTTITYPTNSSFQSAFQQKAVRDDREDVTWYDVFHRHTLTRHKDLSDSSTEYYTRTTYDGLSRPDYEMAPSSGSAGYATSNFGVTTTYDALGRVTETRENVYPYATTKYEYKPGNITRVTDPEGNVTVTIRTGYGSPDDGEVIRLEQWEGNKAKLLSYTTMTYDAWGNMLTARQQGNANGYSADFKQHYSYNNKLELCRHHTREQKSTLFEYDAAGQLIAEKRGMNDAYIGCASLPSDKTRFEYDDLGRLERVNYPGTTPDVWHTYDANGNVLTTRRGTGSDAILWTYTYDYAGDQDYLKTETLTIDNRSYALAYGHDNLGHVTSMTYPSITHPTGRVVTTDPNALGQATEARQGQTSYASNISYHPNGMVASMDLGNSRFFDQALNARQLPSRRHFWTGFDKRYTYDARGRMITSDDLNNTRDEAYAYDGLGRLTQADGPWGTVAYEYDPVNNLRTKTFSTGGSGGSGYRTVELDYDNQNRLEQFRDTDEANVWQGLLYDGRGNIIDSGLQAHGGMEFTYDAANQPVTNTGKPLLRRTLVPDTFDEGPGQYKKWLGGVPSVGPNTDFTVSGGIASLSLTNPQSKYINPRTVITAEEGKTYQITFDVRVVGSATAPGGEVGVGFRRLNPDYTATNTTDAVRTLIDVTPGDPWATHTLQYTATSADGLLRPMLYRRSVLTGPGTIEFRNFVVEEVTHKNINGTYTYDGNMKRVKQVIDGVTIYSVYNRAGQLIHRDNVTTGEETDYISAAGMSIARVTNGTVTTLYTDHLGTPIVGADAQGAVLWRQSHTPYGEDWSAATANDNQNAFTGHVRDSATGLTYMQARFYDPALGRFLSTDPVQFAVDRPDMFNRYGYAANDPVNMIDPDGNNVRAIFSIAARMNQSFKDGRVPVIPTPAPVPNGVGGALDEHVWDQIRNDRVDPGTGTLPDDFFDRKAPDQRTPAGGETIGHGRYNPRTGEYEQSDVTYDEYGRQKSRTDHTDHGYPDDHTDPHTHDREYGPGYGPKGKETRSDKQEPERDPESED